jgi:hypothetical protein
MASPTPLFVIGLLLSQALLDAVPGLRTPEMTQAVAESTAYDPAIDFTTDTLTLGIDGDDKLMLQVATVHRGRAMTAPPQVVELLVIREFPGGTSDDIRASCEGQFKLLVNGEAFERFGIRNLRHVDRQDAGAVAVVFRAEKFSRFAHAMSVQGQACGATFTLNANQLLGMQSFVERWPHLP